MVKFNKVLSFAGFICCLAGGIYSYDQNGEWDFEGPVGVGQASPENIFHVYTSSYNTVGRFQFNGASVARIHLSNTDGSAYFLANDGSIGIGSNSAISSSNLTILSSGAVGVGTTSPDCKLQVYSDANTVCHLKFNGAQVGRLRISNSEGQAYFITNDGFIGIGADSSIGGSALVITSDGNIGIGVSGPSSKLAVNGKICATEIKLQSQPADFVFAENYTLRPLAEVEKFVKVNRHLPEVPSEKEIRKNGGVEVGEMQTKLLQKVEELTLYMIELKKENEGLKNRIAALEQE